MIKEKNTEYKDPNQEDIKDSTYNEESKKDVNSMIESKKLQQNKIYDIVPLDPGQPDGPRTLQITYKKFHNGIYRYLKQLPANKFDDFTFEPESNPFEQFITFINGLKMHVDTLTNEELDFLYEMAKYLEHSHKDSKEAYEVYYKPIVVLFTLHELEAKFDTLEKLFLEMLKMAVFYVTNSCIENVDNAVVRGQKLRELSGGEDVNVDTFYASFFEVFNPELDHLFNFYRWMIYGDEVENISEDTLEQINEFLDKTYEYYVNHAGKSHTEEDPFDCETLLLNYSAFKDMAVQTPLLKHDEVDRANAEVRESFMLNYRQLLKEIYKIYDQDENGMLDSDEMRICVTEFMSSIQMNLDTVVKNLYEFMKTSVKLKLRKTEANILKAYVKEDGSDWTSEELLYGPSGIKHKVPKIRNLDYLHNEYELLHYIDRFDKVFEITFGFK